jgi:hypothetical protein
MSENENWHPDDDFDEPLMPELDRLMWQYESAPRAKRNGLPHMRYAWEIWRYCKTHDEEKVPEFVQKRVDDYCMKVANSILEETDEERAKRKLERSRHEFKDLSDRRLIDDIEALRNRGMTAEKACDKISIRIGFKGGSDSLLREYYRAKDRITPR